MNKNVLFLVAALVSAQSLELQAAEAANVFVGGTCSVLGDSAAAAGFALAGRGIYHTLKVASDDMAKREIIALAKQNGPMIGAGFVALCVAGALNRARAQCEKAVSDESEGVATGVNTIAAIVGTAGTAYYCYNHGAPVEKFLRTLFI
jgi:hypothetical protein